MSAVIQTSAWPELVLDHHLIPARTQRAAQTYPAHTLSVNLVGVARKERVDGLLTKRAWFAEGDVGLHPADEYGRIEWLQAMDVLHLSVSPQALSTYIEEQTDRTMPPLLEQFQRNDPLLSHLGRLMLDSIEQSGPLPLAKLYTGQLTSLLYIHLYRNYTERPPELDPSGGLPTRTLRLVTDYIDAHLPEDLSLKELATVACQSEFHFSRQFKKATGQTPHQFVMARRLTRATTLLPDKQFTLMQIAQLTGFYDVNHLKRHYRRLTGRSLIR